MQLPAGIYNIIKTYQKIKDNSPAMKLAKIKEINPRHLSFWDPTRIVAVNHIL